VFEHPLAVVIADLLTAGAFAIAILHAEWRNR
jgi:hypothetical protein